MSASGPLRRFAAAQRYVRSQDTSGPSADVTGGAGSDRTRANQGVDLLTLAIDVWSMRTSSVLGSNCV
jgi:hypothetical protein